MPNWCEGKLKIRGKIEDIILFLEDGTRYIARCFYLSEQIKPKVEVNECGELKIKCKNIQNVDELYILGTRRHFLTIEKDCFVYDEDKKEQIVLMDFHSAWGIDTPALRDISKKYNIDFKIYAFECGMEFNQDIEIVKGKVIKDNEIKFDDYLWECIFPDLGG